MRISDWSSDVCSSDLDSRERRMEQQARAIALIGVLGIGAQWVAWRTGWPGSALLLLAGVIAGPVAGLIDPEHVFGPLLEPALSIAVAVILFVGGLSLDFRELRKTEGAVTRLVVLGVPIAWIIGALACYRSEEHTSELQSLMRISYAV